MRDPLVAPLAAIAAGILLSRWTSFETGELLIAIAALFVIGVICAVRHHRAAGVAACLSAFFFAGVFVELVHRAPVAPELDVNSRTVAVFEGCVVEPSAFDEDRAQFVLELEPGVRARVNLHVEEGETPQTVRYGQRVEVEGRSRSPHNFGNPGAFDYVRYLARRNIYWTISARNRVPLTVLPGQCGRALLGAVHAIRAAARDRIDWLYPRDTGFLRALLIGDASRLEKVWIEEFRSTGTFHALVISGAHVAVITGFLMLILRMFWVPVTWAGLIAVIVAWFYALVCGWEAPVIRSAAGLTLFVAGSWVHRERRPLNLLAAVGLLFLLIDPEQLLDASFQLSFLSVALLGAIAVPMLDRAWNPYWRAVKDLAETRRDLRLAATLAAFRVEMRLLAETISLWTHWPLRVTTRLIAIPAWLVFWIGALVLTSAVMQAGLALPMAIYFHRVSFSGLSANLFIVPLMGAIVPAGFVSLLTGWTWPVETMLAWSQAIVSAHARWEPAWRVPDPPLWLTAAIVVAIVAASFTRWRLVAAPAAAVLLGVMVWHPFPPHVEPGQLEMTAIDVGQGDAIFVAFPDGRLMLMDGGGISSFGRSRPSRLDIGEDVVTPYLLSRAIRRIDIVALSHAHQDHIGGLRAIIDNFEVRELWTGAMPDIAAWHELGNRAIARGTKVLARRRGDSETIGGARIDVLAPARDYSPQDEPKNNDTLALRISFGERSFLLTGDIERQVEAELIEENLILQTDVLKVAHHGSRTSTTPLFLGAVRPTFAIISAGFENPYNHPHPDVVRRLAERGVAVLRTDGFGLVTIRTNGRNLFMDTGQWMHARPTPSPVFDR